MSFLKKLFGGTGEQNTDRDGIYFYIRSQASGEVIKVRLNRMNDLSLNEDQRGYYARKVVVGQRSFNRIEAVFMFDSNRRLVSAEADKGEFVEEADYEAFLDSQQDGA